MARINFERIEARIRTSNDPYGTHREWARCDLARPAGELRVLAGLINSLAWTSGAVESDGALHIALDHDLSWLVQERAFHGILPIARKIMTETLEILRSEEIPEAYEPQIINEFVLCPRGPHAYPVKNLTAVMPEGCYKTGFLVMVENEKPPVGFYLTSERYSDERRNLATDLLALMFPGYGIKANEGTDRGHVLMDRAPDRLRDYAAACYVAAYSMIEKFRREVESLEWKGKPSVFTNEDNDARDWLLKDIERHPP